MKEILMAFALSFASDYNVTLPPMDFRVHELPDSLIAYSVKHEYSWVITLDAHGMNPDNMKTLVYNQLGKINGFHETDRKFDFMNDKYCMYNFKKIRLYERR
jgi:hypothetical protein